MKNMDAVWFEVGAGMDRETLAVLTATAIETARQWIAIGTERQPALMAALALTAVVPALALAAALIRRLRTQDGMRLEGEPISTQLAIARGLGRPCDGWVSVQEDSRRRCHLRRDVTSIGREPDNDLRLEHATVHQHHAVLLRSGEAQFAIKDLSGVGGNGVKVNGHRVDHVRLSDGDRIEVGGVVLRFEAHPA